MRSRTLRRRRFLQIGASAAVAGPTISCSNAKSRWRFFTTEEAATLEAVCERIIPADQDPGALLAGVVRFIDRQLAGFYKSLSESYRSGLAGIDLTSRSLFHARFRELPAEKQTAVLETLEKGPTKPFFEMVVAHTMQGFYGDPRHGGNREFASWRMLGIPNPPVRGQAAAAPASGPARAAADAAKGKG
jgi:gluconate 2-dehydrogenase gamma chain